MDLEIIGLVLLAAALHAGWNALIKIQGERLAVMAAITLAGSLISLPILVVVAPPDPASWPFLALTVLLHTAYHLFLPVAYDHGDLGQVYPIARGSAPLLVSLGAFVVAGEVLHPLAMLGVLCLAVGVTALAFDRQGASRINSKAIVFALVTAACIASYTVVDGLGARRAGSVLGFAVWLTVCDGLLTAILVLPWRGAAMARVLRRNPLTVFLGAGMQVGAYWIIVWALALAPMAMVSALRETSVLFAAVISTFVLKEGFGVWRFVSASLVTLGLVLSRGQRQ